MLQALLAGTPTLARLPVGRSVGAVAARASAMHRPCRHAHTRTKQQPPAKQRERSLAERLANQTRRMPALFASQGSVAGAAEDGHANAFGADKSINALTRARKLTPTKAMAQASASKALRQQLHAAKVAAEGEEAAGASEIPSDSTLDAISHAPSSLQEQQATAARPLQQSSSEANNVAGASAAKSPKASAAAVAFQETKLIRDVYAWATAESYSFGILISSGRLPQGWQLIQNNEVIHIPYWPGTMKPNQTPGIGEAFIFRSGSYVTWGMSLDQSRKFLRTVIRGPPTSGQSAEIDGYDCVGDETMEYIIAEDQVTRVVGDVIVVGQQPRNEEEIEGDYVDASAVSGVPEEPDWTPLLARLAFSQGLCRSARLSVQEEELSSYLEEVADMPARLEAEGKVPLPRRQVIRKMGTLLKLRQRANLDTENFLDDPEMYWENGELEHHYDSICQALDIETRFKAYNSKLDHGENLLGVLRALLTESSTHRMELIIIYLIAFEVALALISHNYIPSPESVWNAVADFIGGERYSSVLPSATSLAETHSGAPQGVEALPSGGSEADSPQAPRQSYWQWLRSHTPGVRGSIAPALATAGTEHVV